MSASVASRSKAAPGATLETLMARYLAGEESAFAELYRDASPRLRSAITRLTQDTSQAEDLVQSTFLKLHRKRDSYQLGSPVLPWLFVIAKRTFLDEERKLRAKREVLSTTGVLAERGGVTESQEVNSRAVRQALLQLPSAYRSAIELTKLGGFSGEEAASAEHTTSAAIKQRVHRGYALMRTLLQNKVHNPATAAPG